MRRQELVHRGGVPAQGGGDHQPIGGLGERLGPAAESVQHRPSRTQRPVGAPVGVGDRDIRHARRAGAGRQGQPEVADHHVGLHLADQLQILLEIGFKTPAAENRHAAGQPLGEGLWGLGVQGQDLHSPGDPGMVAVGRGQIDLVAVLGQGGGQGQGPRDVGQGGAFADEQHTQLLGSGRGFSPGGCCGTGAWASAHRGRPGKGSHTATIKPPRQPFRRRGRSPGRAGWPGSGAAASDPASGP